MVLLKDMQALMPFSDCWDNMSLWPEHCAQAQPLPEGECCTVAITGKVPVPTTQAHLCLCIASPSRPEEPSTWSGYMGKMFMAATNYLPAQVSDMMNQDRAFATGRLNFSGQKNICTLSTYVQCHQTHRCMFPGHMYEMYEKNV